MTALAFGGVEQRPRLYWGERRPRIPIAVAGAVRFAKWRVESC